MKQLTGWKQGRQKIKISSERGGRVAKKKILVISYGGTIVMVVDPKRKAVVPAKDIKSILELVPELTKYANVSMAVLSNKDSTNVGPGDWTRLANYIKKRYTEFDGFVVTHGTNTMSYTATALSFALGETLSKPVVLTGSQLPLTVYGNDARFNFENAIHTAALASEEGVGEVMVVFDDKVLRGCRTLKVSESSFAAFESPSFPDLGDIRSTGIHLSDRAMRKKANNDLAKPLSNFEASVLSVDLVPGLDPHPILEMMQLGLYDGLILKSHGAGSVPTEGAGSFLPLIHQLSEEYNVPIVITTKFLGGTSIKEINDEPAVMAIEAGATPSGDMTDVASEIKLMWLMSNKDLSPSQVRRSITKDFVGEIS